MTKASIGATGFHEQPYCSSPYMLKFIHNTTKHEVRGRLRNSIYPGPTKCDMGFNKDFSVRCSLVVGRTSINCTTPKTETATLQTEDGKGSHCRAHIETASIQETLLKKQAKTKSFLDFMWLPSTEPSKRQRRNDLHYQSMIQ